MIRVHPYALAASLAIVGLSWAVLLTMVMGAHDTRDVALDALTYCTVDMREQVVRIAEDLGRAEDFERWIKRWYLGPTREGP
jgi:hypothetical protein